MSEQDTAFNPDLITLVDEEENEQAFELLSTMEEAGVTYVALIPYYDNPADSLTEDAELVVLKQVEADGEEMLASIDDDAEYDRIGQKFLEELEELYEDEEQ